jgi:hypothetical protein
MTRRSHAKFIHEGQYVAEIKVDLIVSDDSWSPFLSLEDAYKLDDARAALRRGDIEAASHFGKIYTLKPLAG